MEQKIITPGGHEYMTVAYSSGQIEFRNFSTSRMTIRFDAKVLDQLLPFLNEVNFWRHASKEIENEKSN